MKNILLTSLLCTSTIFAASDPSKTYSYEVTLFTSGILTNSKVGLKDDNYFNPGISLGKNLDNSFIDQLEIAYLRSESVGYKKVADNTNINRTFLNAIKRYELTDRLAAYGLIGAGYQEITQELDKHRDSPILAYGIGLKYDIPYYGIAIKGDVRHLIALKENQNDMMYTVGLGMPLGKRYKEYPITAKTPEVVEKPLTIINIDDDNDGVPNKFDKCPDTLPGIKVNKDGCVETIDLKINFDYDSSTIKPQYQSNLQQFSNILKQDKRLKAIIEAHTDSIASDEYNQALSERRAISVINALNKNGIDLSRLEAIGYGESEPIATNKTEEGRAQNRRVIGFINK